MPTIFSQEELQSVKAKAVPQHVAIIMDGNRRWGLQGHWAGADALVHAVKSAQEIGIKTLTVYGLSTENLLRSAAEVKTLFHIIEKYLLSNLKKMIKEGVKFSVIGDIQALPSTLQEVIETVVERTQECKVIELVIALNYGSRDEIKRAMQKIAIKCLNGQLNISDISEEVIKNHLDTCALQDPDLLIRTSSEMRLSNFLLWQLAYTEIYITNVLWPDFSHYHLLEAILAFQNRERRIGR